MMLIDGKSQIQIILRLQTVLLFIYFTWKKADCNQDSNPQ